MFRYTTAAAYLRLTFHDCVKYTDGTGGCDGCLNWEGVGEVFTPSSNCMNYTKVGNNNGLGGIVEMLEKIYTDPYYPWEGQDLAVSLRDSGKSRADLWSFAGIVATEFGIENNNLGCIKGYPKGEKNNRLSGWACIIGNEVNTTECQVKPFRHIKFQSGRSDCTDFDPMYPYKTTKEEVHPDAEGDGVATVDFFK